MLKLFLFCVGLVSSVQCGWLKKTVHHLEHEVDKHVVKEVGKGLEHVAENVLVRE